jgi:hypothetical protein
MKKIFAITAAVLIAGSFTATAASAKKLKRGYHPHYHSQYYSGGYGYQRGPAYGAYGMMRGGGTPYYPGYGASMQGNNGNSAFGNNSLGHIEGGNIGGGK